jgi:hypothetical protein
MRDRIDRVVPRLTSGAGCALWRKGLKPAPLLEKSRCAHAKALV